MKVEKMNKCEKCENDLAATQKLDLSISDKKIEVSDYFLLINRSYSFAWFNGSVEYCIKY